MTKSARSTRHRAAGAVRVAKLLKIWRTKVLTETVGSVGEASRLSDGRVVVSCGTGSLELVEVQPEGKKRQSGSDWLNGQRLERVVLS
jgi:methionyl-tRNA formyltransferase